MESLWRLDSLAELETRLWLALDEATRWPDAPWRTPVIATVGPDGTGVTARVVVLRTVDRGRRELAFHTDSRAPKVEALRRVPDVAWTFFDPVGQVQLRVTGRAHLHLGDALAQEAWAGVPDPKRKTYQTRLAPGTPVPASPVHHDFTGAIAAHFALVITEVTALDWLWLGQDGHRRAEFLYNVLGRDRAQWLVP